MRLSSPTPRPLPRSSPGAVAALVYRLAVIGLAVCAGGMVLTSRESALRYLLGVSFCVTLFVIVGYRLRVETVAILTLASTVWAFLYEPFPTSIVLSCAVAVALPAASLLARRIRHSHGRDPCHDLCRLGDRSGRS